jgi:hypothetical protein
LDSFFLGILVYQLIEATSSDSLNLVLVWEYLQKKWPFTSTFHNFWHIKTFWISSSHPSKI